jgi:biopolymer transport protein ExbB
MTDLVPAIARFWSGGGILMPILAFVSVAIWYQTLLTYIPLGRATHRANRALRACEADGRGCLEDLQTQGVGGPECAGELPIFSRRLVVLKALVAAAPLLGLLGTVRGMIVTFLALGSRGTASMDVLSTGISEALITTQVGLAVALPGILGMHASARCFRRMETILRRVELVRSLEGSP